MATRCARHQPGWKEGDPQMRKHQGQALPFECITTYEQMLWNLGDTKLALGHFVAELSDESKHHEVPAFTKRLR